MKVSELRIATVSDIHMGHRSNPASEIAANLREAFPDNAETAQLDILFLAGDFFDRELSLSNDDVSETDMVIAYILRLCKKHDIMLRVLKGTQLHDQKQAERFVTINEVAQIGANLKYVNEIFIEHIEQYGITVLYVPDEANASTEKTLTQVKELLQAKGLTQVDFAIMHGAFRHQLPEISDDHKHDSEAYLELVKWLIFVGHVHTFSQYKRIIAQGSFDRLSHGQEEAKGHVRAVVRQDSYELKFVENKKAKKFVTIDCKDLDLDASLRKVQEVIKTLPEESFVRVELTPVNPLCTNMDTLIKLHPFYSWSKKVIEEKTEEVDIITNPITYTPITLTKENLPTLLMERLTRSVSSAAVLVASQEVLKECL